MIHGSCLCKSITFELGGELRSARYCHCENCRKFSGMSPAVWAMAESAQLAITSEAASIAQYDSGRGVRCFCSNCGSPLWFKSLDDPEIVAIPLGVLDDSDIPPPEKHLWVKSKPAWCAITDKLPQFETHPSESVA